MLTCCLLHSGPPEAAGMTARPVHRSCPLLNTPMHLRGCSASGLLVQEAACTEACTGTRAQGAGRAARKPQRPGGQDVLRNSVAHSLFDLAPSVSHDPHRGVGA